MGKFYVTTAIPYVNAAPHIGFTMEVLQGDILARYYRFRGDSVFYLTGTDEHGTKLFNMAQKEGITPQQLVDGHAAEFQKLTSALNITNDDFIRTSSDRHKKGAQKLWKILAKNGDIYKGKYSGLYCSGCEAYVLEKDLIEGKCPIHKTEPEHLEEENYFFKLSKYSDQIKKLISSDELKVVPEARKNEILNIIGETGLTDVSFSRPKKLLPWGIEVPEDPDHVMYVWCDALSNYITALDFENDGENFKKFWPCDAHIIGKDILRFHAGIWIGMLLSAGLQVPKNIYVHGFVTADGQKMSKSIGNVVDPFEMISKYGVDAVRYYLAREIPTTDDGDFSKQRFEALYNNELANNMGNLVNRVFAMTGKYFNSEVPQFSDEYNAASKVSNCADAVAKTWVEYSKGIENFNLKTAIESVISLADFGNRYIEENKPWSIAKTDQELLKNVLYNLLEIIRQIGYLLTPFLPETSEKILVALGQDKNLTSESAKIWRSLKSGSKIVTPGVLFQRIEQV